MLRKCFLRSSRSRPPDWIKSDLLIVSCDTHIAFPSGDCIFNQPDSYSGDQSDSTNFATVPRKLAFSARSSAFGRFVRLQNAFSNSHALYLLHPPLRKISREIVEGDRLSALAILRILSQQATPLAIASRSSNDKLLARRIQDRGVMPP